MEDEQPDERRYPEDRPWRREEEMRPPIVIINESTSNKRPSGLPSDFWEMTYSSDETSAGSRAGDTNMVDINTGDVTHYNKSVESAGRIDKIFSSLPEWPAPSPSRCTAATVR